MLKKCVLEYDHPVLFIESKTSYPKQIITGGKYQGLKISVATSDKYFDIIKLSIYPDESPDLVVVTYGGMAELAASASIDVFMDEEIIVEVIVLGDIRPVSLDAVFGSIIKSGRILVLEEGNSSGGWGAEVAYHIHQKAFKHLKEPVERLGAKDSPIPSSIKMESEVLPTVKSIKKTIKKMVNL
jgi:pyruvate/2-oxoglutarate/acetoin dehydrogenase E1 component